MMVRDRLREGVRDALRRLQERGLFPAGDLPEGSLTVPERETHGDYASNAAFLLAKSARRPPRDLAAALAAEIGDLGGAVARVEVAGAGFVNLFLEDRVWREEGGRVLAEGDRYGEAPRGSRRALVEYVSANPTGPLHVGHGRNAAVGDSTARILEAAGWKVTRAFYVNDMGNQMEALGRTVWKRWREIQGFPIPLDEGDYHGAYVRDLVALLAPTGVLGAAPPESIPESALGLARPVADRLLSGIRTTLERFDVRFDEWVSEREVVHESGALGRALQALKASGATYEKEGALWFRSSEHGDDEDRVLVRRSGEPTYMASDVAYHRGKFEKGFDLLVNVWGADHHGYVPRIRAALEVLGCDPSRLRVLMIQMVSLVRDGKPVEMSKRAGEFTTLEEVLDEVGPDAARFFFLLRSADAPLTFDLGLAKKQGEENPVYYVQYAHARVRSIFAKHSERGAGTGRVPPVLGDRLALPEERALLRALGRYPEVVADAAAALEPHRVPHYLQELASRFHKYYNANRVLTDDPELTRQRLALSQAVAQVVKNGLRLVGVSAPERMDRPPEGTGEPTP